MLLDVTNRDRIRQSALVLGLPAWFARLRMILTSLAVVPLLAVVARIVLSSA